MLQHRLHSKNVTRVDRSQKIRENPLFDIRVALICDEMTYRCFEGLCKNILLTPQNWKKELEGFQPDLFFCESAWSGTIEQRECWRYRIYANHNLFFDNRRELKSILGYCARTEIPTIFWNKEDPTFFSDDAHCFSDTALLFDHVFTTAAECIPKYLQKGANSVNLLSFGYPQHLFYPLPGEFDSNRAVFFGSWYADHPQRCQDMESIFDFVLSEGMKLEIYDRYAGTRNKRNRYPQKYLPYIRASVPYDKIRETIGRPCFAININTVTKSMTMFSRRVFELMACGCVIISNESLGLSDRFGSNIWFLDTEFDKGCVDQIRLENMQQVQRYDTWEQRLKSVFEQTGFA